MAGLEIQFIRDEHDGPLYSTTKNVIVGPNVEQAHRTIRLRVIGETGLESVVHDTPGDSGLGWNLFLFHRRSPLLLLISAFYHSGLECQAQKSEYNSMPNTKKNFAILAGYATFADPLG
jgi:hypothetical protein